LLKKKEKIQAPARHKIPPAFKRLNYLIDHNICDDQIARQLTEDRNSFQAVRIAPQTNALNVIIHKKKTHLELAQYLHAACYSPVKSTFQRAIKNGHFTSWPGLTVDVIKNHLPRSVATVQGHLHQERQGLQTTKQTSQSTLTEIKHMKQIRNKFNSLKNKMKPGQTMEEALLQEIGQDNFPASYTPNVRCNQVAYSIISKEDCCTAYTDLTGRFPQKSSQGNQYLLIG
jgi:hypothetical protein